jgi:dihydrofolate synthase/folylpolyglutamate synthase
MHVVFGAVGDKDLDRIWHQLPEKVHLHFCAADIPRALPVENLIIAAAKAGRIGKSYDSVAGALEGAKSEAANNDLVVVLGSIFVAAEALA